MSKHAEHVVGQVFLTVDLDMRSPLAAWEQWTKAIVAALSEAKLLVDDSGESGYGYCPGCNRDRRLTAWVDGRWVCSKHLTSGFEDPVANIMERDSVDEREAIRRLNAENRKD